MRFACLSAVATSLTLALTASALANDGRGAHRIAATVELPVAVPMGEPHSTRFGWGTMPSVAATLPLRDWLLAGVRLRAGFLSDGAPPSDSTLADPKKGGLLALSAVVRLRPRSPSGSRLSGPWLELGGGPGLTGDLVRPVAEAGLGWTFPLGSLAAGPSLRYLQVVQPASDLDGTDAKLLLVGIEIGLHDPHTSASTPAPDQAQPPTVAKEQEPPAEDADGDGVPDEVDKCRTQPEDKDGFEDGDGCPEPDNDGDGLADRADACPNEPETVNGVDDEDGCPDEAPVVVKQDRILLTQHLLFDTDRARVKSEGRPALKAVYELWNQHPEWDYLVVDGYADKRGPDDYNLWLSRTRAERVRKALMELGFPGDKLRLRAFGKRQLRVAGDGDEVNRQNRRVEFVIVKKAQAQAGDEMPPQAATPPPTQEGGP